jgi:hypothetical protein
VQAFIHLWEVYYKPADTDGDKAVSFDEFVAAREARLQMPHARERGVGSTPQSSLSSIPMVMADSPGRSARRS